MTKSGGIDFTADSINYAINKAALNDIPGDECSSQEGSSRERSVQERSSQERMWRQLPGPAAAAWVREDRLRQV